MIKIEYFKRGNSMCASDLENSRQTENINLNQISSLSDVKKFNLPLSGTYKGDYVIINMQNGDRFFIDEVEYKRISEIFTNKRKNNKIKCICNTMQKKDWCKFTCDK